MRKLLFLLVFFASTLGVMESPLAAQPAVYQTADGAINGYDAVAYFVSDAPVKGDKAHAHQWNGATWYFANANNLELFKAAPEKYAPQYGGY